MNVSLGRIILFVQSVERLKDFYQTHFQFELLEEIKDEWALLKAGDCEIALHRVGTAYRGINPSSSHALNNVKLVFETDNNLRQLRVDLIRSNVIMKDIIYFGNSPCLYCDGQDPEGNVFQLMQREPAYR